MTKTAGLRNARMRCTNCGAFLLTPDHSFDFSEEQLVINLWLCSECGHRFETDTAATAPPPTVVPDRVEAKPDPPPVSALLVA